MSNTIYQIYDKIFKKILTLSTKSVINLINGLFETNYPLDSKITYNWTEFEDKHLKRILADTILTINDAYSYHLEAQITNDSDIIFRMFEYGFGHANRTREKDDDLYVLHFPEPKIIFLYSKGQIPASYTVTLDFGTQGTFDYKVPAISFLETTPQELNDKKMIILIPFMLLKLRDLLQKERSPENLVVLKNLIQNDIIGSIDENLRVGNITYDDAQILKRLTHKLYVHIYSHYNEMEELNDMTDESLVLDIDIYLEEHERNMAAKDAIIAEQENTLTEQAQTLAELRETIAALQAEIAQLKSR